MTEEKRPVGRPSKYNAELQELADTYIYEYKNLGDVIPSRIGLCCFLGISKRASHEWGKIHPAFKHTLENIEALQENTALNRGLDGSFNPAITKLVLHNHGYSDKVEQAHTSPDGSMSAPTRIELVAPDDNAKG